MAKTRQKEAGRLSKSLQKRIFKNSAEHAKVEYLVLKRQFKMTTTKLVF